MSQTEKLLPCPFCGCAPRLVHYSGGHSGGNCQVLCDNCGVRTATYMAEFPHHAASDWNRRAAPPTETGEVRHRTNIEDVDGGIRICRGDHAKTEPCEWEFYAVDGEAAGTLTVDFDGYVESASLSGTIHGDVVSDWFAPKVPGTKLTYRIVRDSSEAA